MSSGLHCPLPPKVLPAPAAVVLVIGQIKSAGYASTVVKECADIIGRARVNADDLRESDVVVGALRLVIGDLKRVFTPECVVSESNFTVRCPVPAIDARIIINECRVVGFTVGQEVVGRVGVIIRWF